MTVQRTYWGVVAVALGAAVAYLTMPQIRWIAPAVGVLRAELTDFGYSNLATEDADALDDSLFGRLSTRDYGADNWSSSLRLAEETGLTPVAAALLVREALGKVNLRTAMSQQSTRTPLSNLALEQSSRATCSVVLRICDKLCREEPHNAFWLLGRAVAHWKLGDFQQSRNDLSAAARCSAYNNHSWDEATERFAWRSRQVGAEVPTFQLSELSVVMFPELFRFRSLEVVMTSSTDLQSTLRDRVNWARIGLLMCRSSEFPSEKFAGLGIVQTSLTKPGPNWSQGDPHSQTPLSRYSLEDFSKVERQDPGNLATLKSANLLAKEKDWSDLAPVEPTNVFLDVWLGNGGVLGMAVTVGGLLVWLVCVASGLITVWVQGWSWPSAFGKNLCAFAIYPLVAYVAGPASEQGLAVLLAGSLIYLLLCRILVSLKSIAWVPLALVLLVLVMTVLPGPSNTIFGLCALAAILATWGMTFAREATWWASALHATMVTLFALWIGGGNSLTAYHFEPSSLAVWAGAFFAVLAGSLALRTTDRNRAYFSACVVTGVGCLGLVLSTVVVTNVQHSAKDSIESVRRFNDAIESRVAQVLHESEVVIQP